MKTRSLVALAAEPDAMAGPVQASRPFRWGAASAAYQVEGSATADNKGRSIWDVYLDDHSLAGPGVSGAVAINFYDRDQYLEDIALFKALGLNSYRFSISWPRILPDGQGPVNPKAIAHYRRFITDLKAAGIEPMLTLYHWDMPAQLAAAGGWSNPKSIDWFQRYADVVFANFSDLVDSYVLINEPTVERATKQLAEDRLNGESGDMQIIPGQAHLADALKTFNHILLASAAAKESFSRQGYTGQIGLALPLFPTLTSDGASEADKQAAILADGILNRWFLDAMYHGTYPEDVLELARELDLDTGIKEGDAARIGAAHFDYLGINYYAPLFVRRPAQASTTYAAQMYVPDTSKAAFNGPVRPDQFKALLERIRLDYGNPPVVITENGAGFPDEDQLVDGKVEDLRRCDYLVTHIEAMKSAMADGADVRGYHVWSSHDNLEWLSGYGSRFGLIYVDFDTQKRIPKLSFQVYARMIKGEPVDTSACNKGQ